MEREMALLSPCWFFISNILIPQGPQRCYFMSFFFHPFLIGFCQLYLCIKFIGSWFSNVFAYPVCIIFPMISAMLILFRYCSLRFRIFVISAVSWIRFRDSIDLSESSSLEIKNPIQSTVNFNCCGILSVVDISRTEDDHQITTDEEHGRKREENFDEFYQKYIERMNWFDLLNYERTCGLSSILNKQLGNWSFSETFQIVNQIPPSITWSKVGKKKIIKSLESDFETVYVAQSCLCWEALEHQYMKIQELVSSDNTHKSVLFSNISEKFQQFRILLERFMENERGQGERFWNYVQSRFPLRNLLQVPALTGYSMVETMAKEGEAIGARVAARVVLEDIDESIMVFLDFLRAERKNRFWRSSKILWTKHRVEDPNDLEMLTDVTKALQKKKQSLKDLERSKRCWLKGKDPIEESQRLENVFSMIDIKLISRVLKMSMISTNQLLWCQEKLRNIKFEGGKIKRIPSTSMFPSS